MKHGIRDVATGECDGVTPPSVLRVQPFSHEFKSAVNSQKYRYKIFRLPADWDVLTCPDSQ